MPIQAPFRLDEGYSEDTRSQSESEGGAKTESVGDGNAQTSVQSVVLPEWVSALSEEERSELAYSLIQTLRTSSIASLVGRLTPRLHLDPVIYLPPELTSEIFSYLEPATILQASMVSRIWRDRAIESRLWKQMYGREGWKIEGEEVQRFESQTALVSNPPETKPRSRRAETDASQQAQRKRIQTGSSLFNSGPTRAESFLRSDDEMGSRWNRQHDTVEADVEESQPLSAPSDVPDQMEDVDYHTSTPPSQGMLLSPNASRQEYSFTSQDSQSSIEAESLSTGETTASNKFMGASIHFEPTLTTPGSFGMPKLNWLYLYKQRKRLEDNWNSGRFTNFQLPHPDHMNESHRECVYTIQYSGKYLVSGSRDKTLRIWNLDSRRLARKPLVGHTGSVLCLQFDERPDQDIIISGSSDTDVIVWRFSTGEMIKKIEHAHRESVLNLRFDDRFLVTCSKDRTIKVWNRTALMPSDDDYPTRGSRGATDFPAYIIDRLAYMNDIANNPFSRQDVQPLPPFSLVMVLKGHGAAVNAIQVYENQVVSASGDRTVKIWDLRTGDCLMTVSGHMKGIACVQFDGRRIVSGSSDNTVRIFDRATGAEVACLLGHSNLVRTVQAGFGDLPGNEEDLLAEAREVDRKFFEARARGEISTETPRRSRRNQANFGSRDPKDILGYGMRLPPGGGGSRWARIVSGSYDETVIVWKRDVEGKWVIGSRLRQEDAARAAGGGMTAADVARVLTQRPANPNDTPDPVANNFNALPLSTIGDPTTIPPIPTMNSVQAANQATINATLLNLAQHGIHGPQAVAQAIQAVLNNNNPNAGPAGPNMGLDDNTLQNNTVNPVANPQLLGAQALSALAQAPAQHQPQIQPPPPPHHPHLGQQHAHHHRHLPGINIQPNSRVFKLQFDARRIICCSQDPRIVGWDFANGDEEIIQASRFFSGP